MKQFFWKDKSGRGYSNTFTLADVMKQDNETNWDGDELHEWAANAEIGDEWENSSDKYVRIK